MASVQIQINAQDNLSATIQNLQNQLSNLKNTANNINIGGNAGSVGGIARGFTLGSIAANYLTSAVNKLKLEFEDAIDKFQIYQTQQRQLAFAMTNDVTKLATIAGEVERIKVGKFAKEFGLNVMETTSEFAKFAAATRGTSISIEETEVIFQGITKAVATFGLDSAQSSRIFKAFTDIISKGKPQAEELVRQFGNNLPGGLTIAANAIGKTTAEFRQLMKEGKLTSDIVVQIGKYMDETFGESAKSNLNTLRGNLNNLTNAFDEFKIKLAEGFGPAMIVVLKTLTTLVEKLSSLIPDTLRYAVAKDLADTFETSEKGKKLKEAQKKGPKEVQKLLEQEQADYIKNIREQYDFSRPEYKLQQGMQDPNILTRPDLQVFYKPETLEKIKKYKDKSTKENFTTAFESAIADLGQAIDSENIIQKATKQIARGVARNVAGPAVDLLQATELPKLDPATKTLVKDFLKQKGEVEMIQKAATETVTFPPDGDDKNKLKTDYHTPRIININILTGEGASVIGGNVPVNISTNKVDSKEIKNNIENVLNEGLDYVMSDLSSSILRVSKSTGMS